ncbi:hypothetical protein HAX54_027918, partial [Datura stramonium]|nr:hypothetical protein [Datura stramonium]
LECPSDMSGADMPREATCQCPPHSAGMGMRLASLVLDRHGHAPSGPLAWQAWGCAHRPSRSADMGMPPNFPLTRP